MNLEQTFTSAGQPGASNLVIRFSAPQDKARVYDFYRHNQHKHVDQRKVDVWNERTENGRVIIVEDNEQNIGFVSVAYDYAETENGPVKWIELGSTTNKQNPAEKPYEMIKGINLYPSIVAAQTIYEFLVNTPEDKLIANIFDDNTAVIHMLNKKVGWHFFEPDEAILKATKTTKDSVNEHEQEAGDVWLAATTDTLPHQARMVLKFIDEGTSQGLFNKKSGRHIGLDVSSFSLANEFRAAVEALAYGPVARHLESNPHMGMAAARKYLESHLKSPLQSPPGPQP